MEAFEQFVALAMEADGLLVSGPHKFMVKRKTKKQVQDEFQSHGYEVDLVGMRKDKLVLATVKSFFGSKGVQAKEVTNPDAPHGRGYAMLNNVELRDTLIRQAAEQFGYDESDVELRLYAGKFPSIVQELAIREWASKQKAGSGSIKVFGASQVVSAVRVMANSTTYRDNPVLVSLKVMDAAGVLPVQIEQPLHGEELLRVYQETVISFKAADGRKVSLQPTESPAPQRDSLETIKPGCYDAWVFTAENPKSALLSAKENRARMRELAKDLDKRGRDYQHAVGSSPNGDWSEESFIIWSRNQKESESIERQLEVLAEIYEQNAYFRLFKNQKFIQAGVSIVEHQASSFFAVTDGGSA